MSAVYAELENRLIGSFAGKMGNAVLTRASPPAQELAHAAGTSLGMREAGLGGVRWWWMVLARQVEKKTSSLNATL